jgi:NACHT domain- and WD repeat-containing protein
LALAKAERPLILFLDSLDQLSTTYSTHVIAWLPSELPKNVRLIVTTRPGEHLNALKNKLPPENLLELEPMMPEEGEVLLNLWLKDVGRLLQDFQRREVLDKFYTCRFPLYLKLAFEEARRWKSYTDNIRLSQGIEGIIKENLIKRLETDHSRMLIARCLGYIAASQGAKGLSEDEILEILSLDTDFFENFLKRARHKPPEPKLPVVVWSRLYFDLEPYLSTTNHEGTVLFTFFHRELGEVARNIYLVGDEKTYHQVLSDYFLSKADPEVEPQKTEGRRAWKGTPRALSELPYHLSRGHRWDELFQTLVDFTFLEEKATRVGVQENIDAKGNRTISYTGALALKKDYDLALKDFPQE